MKVTNIALIGFIVLSAILGFLLIQDSDNNADANSEANDTGASLAELENMNNTLVEEKQVLLAKIEDYRAKEQYYAEVEKKLQAITNISNTGDDLTLANNDSDPSSVISQSIAVLEKNQKEMNSLRKERKRLRTEIDKLKKKLSASDADNAKIQGQIEKLQSQMNLTDVQITQLQNKIDKTEQLIAKKDIEINTIYYVVGTKGQLREKGITQKEGGVLWGLLGATEDVRNDFSQKEFRTQNLAQSDEIEINANIDDIIIHSKQLKSAYELVSIDENSTILKVKDHEKFRKDKHLVIEIED